MMKTITVATGDPCVRTHWQRSWLVYCALHTLHRDRMDSDRRISIPCMVENAHAHTLMLTQDTRSNQCYVTMQSTYGTAIVPLCTRLGRRLSTRDLSEIYVDVGVLYGHGHGAAALVLTSTVRELSDKLSDRITW